MFLKDSVKFKEIVALQFQGKFLEALSKVDEIIIQAKKKSHHQSILNGLIIKGEILWNLHLDDELLGVVQDYGTLLKSKVNIEKQSLFYFNAKLIDLKSCFYNVIRDHKKAVQYIEESLKYKRKHGLDSDIITSLIISGIVYSDKFDSSAAIKQFQEAVNLAERENNKEAILFINYRLGYAYYREFDYNQSRKHFDLSMNLSKELKNEYYQYLTMIGLGYVGNRLVNVKESLNHLLKALDMVKKFEDPYNEIITINLIAENHVWLGKFDQALKFTRQSLNKYKEFYNDRPSGLLAYLFCHMCRPYLHLSELDKAFDYAQKAVTMCRKLNDLEALALSLYYLGATYWIRGDLKQAIQFQKESIDVAKEIGDIYFLTWTSRVTGRILVEQGELDQALKIIQESIENFEYQDNKEGLSEAFQDIARIYFEKGDFNQSLDYAKQAYQLRNELFNTTKTAVILVLIIRICLEMNEISQAKSFLSDLEKIYEQEKNDLAINQRYRLVTALINKATMQPENSAEIENLLVSIVEEDITRSWETVVALLNLCDLLLKKYQIDGDKYILNELQNYTQKLVEFSQKQESYTLKLEAQHIRILTLWLQAQHSTTHIDLNEIQSLLANTLQIAEMKGLTGLAKRIFDKHRNMLDHLEVWDEFLRSYYDLIRTE
ncbi:MAG: tetratricopeptide repeat protein [Asgard group archaeon]|nr:tetratricopeptide repeat protein [Asgard group archaeon]